MKKILCIPGDGIGPEVTEASMRLLGVLAKKYSMELSVDWEDYGAERWLKEKVGLPKGSIETIKQKYDAIIFGALGDPRIPDMAHGREILLGLRFGLDLYVNLRPVKLLNDRLGVLKETAKKQIDLVIFRENTQDLYVGAGGSIATNSKNEVAIDECIHTYNGVERIIRQAFLYARKNRRKKVTLVDKSNAIKFSGQLWQRVFSEISKDFLDIEVDHLFADVAALEMVKNPGRFDVIVTSNLFGDILSDLGAGLAGGLGLAASANINPDSIALFEPVHGSAPDIAGKNVANPFASFMSLAMFMTHFGCEQAAQDIENAVSFCVEKKWCTKDLGGDLSTKAATDAVAENIL